MNGSVVGYVRVHFQRKTYCRSTDSSEALWLEEVSALCSTPEPGKGGRGAVTDCFRYLSRKIYTENSERPCFFTGTDSFPLFFSFTEV